MQTSENVSTLKAPICALSARLEALQGLQEGGCNPDFVRIHHLHLRKRLLTGRVKHHPTKPLPKGNWGTDPLVPNIAVVYPMLLLRVVFWGWTPYKAEFASDLGRIAVRTRTYSAPKRPASSPMMSSCSGLNQLPS